MITLSNVNNFNRTLSFFGLSSDTKPTGIFVQDEVSRYSVTNGSVFVEIDTGDEYMFDDASDTWVKIEGGGGASKRMVVDELPTEDIDPNTTYLVANDSGNADNAYTEYMYVNDEWEALGPYVANVWVPGAAPGSAMLSGSKSSISSSATYAVAEGYRTIASNNNAHAEGTSNTASGAGSHAEGGGSTASGSQSHAEGGSTTASGINSHAEGGGTQANGSHSHAEGGGTTASGNTSHAEGGSTIASGMGSHAEGGGTTADGKQAHAEGGATKASGDQSHAEGVTTEAKGNGSHAEGSMTMADGTYAHVEGRGAGKDGKGNYITITINDTTYIPGAHGQASHAEGCQTVAGSSSIKYSHAEGYQTVAIGDASHAEGYSTIASNTDAHAEGAGTKASGNVSHAEGSITTASGNVSHAEGTMTTASGDYSHAEGDMTTASGQSSHAEGQSTTASGRFSHAEGDWTKASGAQSHAEGYYTTANHASQHVFGEYNIEDGSSALGTERGSYIEIVGNGEMLNGSSTIVRSNARTLDWNGNEWLAGNVSVEDVMLPLEEGSDTRTSLLDKIAELSSSSGGGSGIKREIVNTLPTTDIDPDTIYLIADSDGSGDNTYIEYMYVNDTWEALGSYIPDIWGRGTGTNSAIFKGENNTATGANAIAEGSNSQATADAAHAEGAGTKASGVQSHAEGGGTEASGNQSHAEGGGTKASGDQSHSEGNSTNAFGDQSHSEGSGTVASGDGSHAEGGSTEASGKNSHSEGAGTKASGVQSHAEGGGTEASGVASHAEGGGTIASGDTSHAEGAGTEASGVQSHAEGGGTRASGNQSHSEGSGTVASGGGSHAEGGSTIASGEYSHAEGGQTIANHKSQHVFGEWNIEDGSSALGTERGSYIEIVGNGERPDGSSTVVRSNARTLDWSGNEWLAGNVSVEDVMLPLEDGSNTRTSLLDKLDAFDTDVTNLSEDITNLSTNITNVVAQQVEQMQIHEGQTVIDSTLTVQGAAADAKKTGDELTNLKSAFSEFPEGSYPDMTVGGVMSMDGGAEDQVPYTFRASGGGVAVGNREIDTLVGGTVAWNQLIRDGNFPSVDNWATNNNGGSISVSNNILTFTRVDASIGSTGIKQVSTIPKLTGHKILFSAECYPSANSTIRFGAASAGAGDYGLLAVSIAANAWTRVSQIGNVASGNTALYLNVYISGGDANDTVQITNLCAFDLTQMFGPTIADYLYALETAHAGDGVAWFKRLFPNDYYAYDAGTLKSVEGVSAHKTTGFNQCDEEWEVYGTSQIRSKNRMPVLPGLTYYAKTPSVGISLYFKAQISDTANVGSVSVINNTFTVPTNAHYAVVYANASYGTVYKNDICINISGDRNGTYEPYTAHSCPLDSTLTLRGIPKLDAANRLYYDGDTYSSDGTVTRWYGIVDLGTLSWTYSASPNEGFYCDNIGAKIPQTTAQKLVGICPIYAIRSYNDVFAKTYDKSIAVRTNGGLRIYDSAYTDATAFKTAMSGVYLVYELATPTTETADPYTNPQIVDASGTEEYVTTGIVPVGHYTKYPADIVSKVDGLPKDFSTLIAPTETGFKASRAYSVNNFLIIQNQLYKVTASIASGATITPGTNVSACTVADILTQLLNA